jgi:hypothetical protein
MKLPIVMMRGSLLIAAWVAAISTAQAATPAELLAIYSAQAGSPGSAERGQQFFTAPRKGEFGWSCSTCHGNVPTGTGKHDLSEKPITPLAPAFNPARFTDLKKTDGWFRNNCKDTLGRECTAQEKADLLAWLITLKP